MPLGTVGFASAAAAVGRRAADAGRSGRSVLGRAGGSSILGELLLTDVLGVSRRRSDVTGRCCWRLPRRFRCFGW